MRKRQLLPRQRTYFFEGRKMNYQVVGRGKPVVLLHGALSAYPWDGFEKRLGKKYRVYLPHLPGFGASEVVSGKRHNTDLYAKVFTTFLDELGLKRATVVGLSLGAVVAVKMAAASGYQGRLVLVGAPFEITGRKTIFLNLVPRFLRRVLVGSEMVKKRLLIPALRTNVGFLMARDLGDYAILLRSTDSRSIADVNYVKEIGRDFPAALAKVKKKVIFLYGESDVQRKIAKKRGINYKVIKGAGHNPFRTNPEAAFKSLTSVL